MRSIGVLVLKRKFEACRRFEHEVLGAPEVKPFLSEQSFPKTARRGSSPTKRVYLRINSWRSVDSSSI